MLRGDLLGSLSANLRMHWQPHHEKAVILVEFENGSRRAIFLHGMEDFRDTSSAPLRDVEFLEKVTDSPIAVASGTRQARLQLSKFDRAIRSPPCRFAG